MFHQEDGILILALVSSQGEVTLNPDVESPAPLSRNDMMVKLVGAGRKCGPRGPLLA